MEFINYQASMFDECMALFDSNLAPYFIDSEKAAYQNYLNKLSEQDHYFVVKDNKQFVAAGGFSLCTDQTVRFTWGMVKRERHGSGIGTFLTDQRLKSIKSLYPNSVINLDTSQLTVEFYKHRGFHVVSETKNGYDEGMHKIEMTYRPRSLVFITTEPMVGTSLIIRPIEDPDFEALFMVASDKEIWSQHPAWDRFKKAVFQEFFDSAVQSGLAYVVIDKSNGTIIGSSRYNMPDFESNSVEIGWTFLARKYWGGTANAEMKSLMLGHAYNSFQRVHFCIGANNHRSMKAVLKLGAKQLQQCLDPNRSDSLFFELTEKDYLSKLAKSSITGA